MVSITPASMKSGTRPHRRNGTPDPGVTVILDGGSHINAHAQTPRANPSDEAIEHVPPAGAWSEWLGSNDYFGACSKTAPVGYFVFPMTDHWSFGILGLPEKKTT